MVDDICAFDDFIEKVFEIKNVLETIAEKQAEVKSFNKENQNMMNAMKKGY